MNHYKQYIAKLTQNQFFQGSAILFVGTFLVNIITYLFNVIVGRLLGDNAKFGEYFSLMSIVYLLSVPAAMFGTTVTKYVSVASATDDYERIKNILVIVTKYALYFVFVVVGILIIFNAPLSKILKITDTQNLIWLSLVYATSFPLLIPGSALNGLQKFGSTVLYSGALIMIRLILAVLFILAGYSVNGILMALIISNIVMYAAQMIHVDTLIKNVRLTWTHIPNKVKLFTRKIFTSHQQDEQEVKKELFEFSKHSLATMLGLGILVQADVILAKVFLSPTEAGIYASLALIGKVIPFFSQPLIQVMFPYITKKYTRKENFLSSFALVIGFVFLCSGAISAIYIIFPTLIVGGLFGQKFLPASQYIGLFSVFEVTYALINAFVYFFLSIDKNKLASSILIAGLLQVAGIYLFHKDITQIITISTAICSAFVLWYIYSAIRIYKENTLPKEL
jgi:O-antigen/teichoic acid export membrane protein